MSTVQNIPNLHRTDYFHTIIKIVTKGKTNFMMRGFFFLQDYDARLIFPVMASDVWAKEKILVLI